MASIVVLNVREQDMGMCPPFYQLRPTKYFPCKSEIRSFMGLSGVFTALNLPQDLTPDPDAQMGKPAGSEDKVGWVALVIGMPPGPCSSAE